MKRILIFAISLLLAACAAQTATPSPPSQAVPTLDLSAYATPTLVPATPEGVVREIGYNVKGWV
ncbi:MAG: hypothetical protein ACE5GO_08115 [Anaerolineales bacterium]